MKNNHLLVIILFEILPFLTYSQVGLLSSNNKNMGASTKQDSSNFPALSVTKELGNYSLISKNDSIKLNFTNRGIDSVYKLKENIANESTAIEGYKVSITNLSNQINNSISGLKIGANNEEKKRHKKELEALKKQLDETTNKLHEAETNNSDSKRKLADQVLRTELTDSLNKKLVAEIVNRRAEAINEKLSILTKLNNNNSFDLYKNQYGINSYWFLIDSTKETFNKNSFLDSLSKIYSNIRVQSDANDYVSKYLEKTTDKFINAKLLSGTTAIASIQDYQNLNKVWQDLEKDTANLGVRIREAYEKLEGTVKNYNAIIKANIKEKVTKKELKTSDFGAFPQLTSILGKKETIPQLQLYGSYNYENPSRSFEANVGLSFAPTNTPDTANLYNIFIPAASKFLIHSNFTWSFLPVGTKNNDSAKKVGFRLDVSFASKNLAFDAEKTVRIISSSILYARAGIELAVMPKRLSVYGNVNTATILDKVDDFKAGTGLSSKAFGYIDCGAKFYLDPTPNSKVSNDLFIFSNLNFIVNSGDVRRVTKSNDLAIPSLQIGIVKNLGKF